MSLKLLKYGTAVDLFHREGQNKARLGIFSIERLKYVTTGDLLH